MDPLSTKDRLGGGLLNKGLHLSLSEKAFPLPAPLHSQALILNQTGFCPRLCFPFLPGTWSRGKARTRDTPIPNSRCYASAAWVQIREAQQPSQALLFPRPEIHGLRTTVCSASPERCRHSGHPSSKSDPGLLFLSFLSYEVNSSILHPFLLGYFALSQAQNDRAD